MAEVTIAPAAEPALETTPVVVPRARPAWDVGLSWAALTALGFVASGALTNGALLGASRGASLGVGGLLATPVRVALGLALVATLQWTVLRRAARGTSWGAWVLASLGGQIAGTLAVGVAVMAPLALGLLGGVAGLMGAAGLSFAARVVSAALLGAVVGAAQWTVLRHRVTGAVAWIAAAALAYAAAAFVPVPPSGAPGGATAFLLGRLAYGAVLGAVTGGALAWLVRRTARG